MMLMVMVLCHIIADNSVSSQSPCHLNDMKKFKGPRSKVAKKMCSNGDNIGGRRTTLYIF